MQGACPHFVSGRVERNKLVSQARNPPPAVGRNPCPSFLVPERRVAPPHSPAAGGKVSREAGCPLLPGNLLATVVMAGGGGGAAEAWATGCPGPAVGGGGRWSLSSPRGLLRVTAGSWWASGGLCVAQMLVGLGAGPQPRLEFLSWLCQPQVLPGPPGAGTDPRHGRRDESPSGLGVGDSGDDLAARSASQEPGGVLSTPQERSVCPFTPPRSSAREAPSSPRVEKLRPRNMRPLARDHRAGSGRAGAASPGLPQRRPPLSRGETEARRRKQASAPDPLRGSGNVANYDN